MKSGWTEVMLGDVAEINPLQRDRPGDEEMVAFVGMAQLSARTAIASDLEQRRYGDVSTGYSPFEHDDLLVAKITPCFENGKVGQARLSTKYGRGSTEFHVVRPAKGSVDHRYLLHFLRREDFRKLARHASDDGVRWPATCTSAIRGTAPDSAAAN